MAGKAQKAGSSKAPQSERKKFARAKCRANAKQRHEQAGHQQELRHQANLRLIKDDGMLPWERACAERDLRRRMMCGQCRIPFENGADVCPSCGGTLNLKAAWEKRQ